MKRRLTSNNSTAHSNGRSMSLLASLIVLLLQCGASDAAAAKTDIALPFLLAETTLLRGRSLSSCGAEESAARACLKTYMGAADGTACAQCVQYRFRNTDMSTIVGCNATQDFWCNTLQVNCTCQPCLDFFLDYQNCRDSQTSSCPPLDCPFVAAPTSSPTTLLPTGGPTRAPFAAPTLAPTRSQPPTPEPTIVETDPPTTLKPSVTETESELEQEEEIAPNQGAKCPVQEQQALSCLGTEMSVADGTRCANCIAQTFADREALKAIQEQGCDATQNFLCRTLQRECHCGPCTDYFIEYQNCKTDLEGVSTCPALECEPLTEEELAELEQEAADEDDEETAPLNCDLHERIAMACLDTSGSATCSSSCIDERAFDSENQELLQLAGGGCDATRNFWCSIIMDDCNCDSCADSLLALQDCKLAVRDGAGSCPSLSCIEPYGPLTLPPTPEEKPAPSPGDEGSGVGSSGGYYFKPYDCQRELDAAVACMDAEVQAGGPGASCGGCIGKTVGETDMDALAAGPCDDQSDFWCSTLQEECNCHHCLDTILVYQNCKILSGDGTVQAGASAATCPEIACEPVPAPVAAPSVPDDANDEPTPAEGPTSDAGGFYFKPYDCNREMDEAVFCLNTEMADGTGAACGACIRGVVAKSDMASINDGECSDMGKFWCEDVIHPCGCEPCADALLAYQDCKIMAGDGTVATGRACPAMACDPFPSPVVAPAALPPSSSETDHATPSPSSPVSKPTSDETVAPSPTSGDDSVSEPTTPEDDAAPSPSSHVSEPTSDEAVAPSPTAGDDSVSEPTTPEDDAAPSPSSPVSEPTSDEAAALSPTAGDDPASGPAANGDEEDVASLASAPTPADAEETAPSPSSPTGVDSETSPVSVPTPADTAPSPISPTTDDGGETNADDGPPPLPPPLPPPGEVSFCASEDTTFSSCLATQMTITEGLNCRSCIASTAPSIDFSNLGGCDATQDKWCETLIDTCSDCRPCVMSYMAYQSCKRQEARENGEVDDELSCPDLKCIAPTPSPTSSPDSGETPIAEVAPTPSPESSNEELDCGAADLELAACKDAEMLPSESAECESCIQSARIGADPAIIAGVNCDATEMYWCEVLTTGCEELCGACTETLLKVESCKIRLSGLSCPGMTCDGQESSAAPSEGLSASDAVSEESSAPSEAPGSYDEESSAAPSEGPVDDIDDASLAPSEGPADSQASSSPTVGLHSSINDMSSAPSEGPVTEDESVAPSEGLADESSSPTAADVIEASAAPSDGPLIVTAAGVDTPTPSATQSLFLPTPAPAPSSPSPPTTPGPCHAIFESFKGCLTSSMSPYEADRCFGCHVGRYPVELEAAIRLTESCEDINKLNCFLYDDCGCSETCLQLHEDYTQCLYDSKPLVDQVKFSCTFDCAKNESSEPTVASNQTSAPTQSPLSSIANAPPTEAPTLPVQSSTSAPSSSLSTTTSPTTTGLRGFTPTPAPSAPKPLFPGNSFTCVDKEVELLRCFSAEGLQGNSVVTCAGCLGKSIDEEFLDGLYPSSCNSVNTGICGLFDKCPCGPCADQVTELAKCELEAKGLLDNEKCQLDCDATLSPTITSHPTREPTTEAPSQAAVSPDAVLKDLEGDGVCSNEVDTIQTCLGKTRSPEDAQKCSSCMASNLEDVIYGHIHGGCENLTIAACDLFRDCNCDPCFDAFAKSATCLQSVMADFLPYRCAVQCPLGINFGDDAAATDGLPPSAWTLPSDPPTAGTTSNAASRGLIRSMQAALMHLCGLSFAAWMALLL